MSKSGSFVKIMINLSYRGEAGIIYCHSKKVSRQMLYS
jgi:hypothetical protein